MHRRLATLLACGATALLSCLLPAAAPAFGPGQMFGIGDQRSLDMFSDPQFQALHVQTVRWVLDWNAAVLGGRDRDTTDTFYVRAVEAGVRPLIAFNGFGERRAPSVAAFSKAARAAVARWPKADFEVWNEANHYTQPTYRRPALVARYARVMDALCRTYGCTSVPVTLVLLAEVRKDAFWIRSFVKAYGRVPRIWGLHTYGDANRRSNSRLARFVKAWPSGKIWITETATWEHFADTFTPSTARQAQLVPWAFRPALSYPRRVDRLYWYQWRGPSSANARWDSGLLDSDGTLRPVYEAVKRERFRSLR